jgi:hypothetical protein
VEEAKYREKANKTNGLDFVSYKREEIESDIYITVAYNFSSIDALNAALSNNKDSKITVRRSAGNTTTYTQIISRGTPVNEDTLTLANAIFKDKYIKVKVIAPQNLKSVSDGTMTGRTGEISYPLVTILGSETSFKWDVVW